MAQGATQQAKAKDVVKASLEPVVQPAPASASAPESPVKSYRFVKSEFPAQTVVFADKTTFNFELKYARKNEYSTMSEFVTSDEALAAKLRAAVKQGIWHIFECAQ
jgi:hypothetical protein